MRRFFIDVQNAETMTITGSDAHHIKDVLRMKCGDEVNIITSDKKNTLARIEKISEDGITLRSLSSLEETSAIRRVVLAQGLSKNDKMEFVVQKAVEMGITDFIPLKLSRCIVKLDNDKKGKRVERWQKIAHEAAKQSQHSTVPIIHPLVDFASFLQDMHDGLRILAYEQEKLQTLKNFLRNNDLHRDIYIVVGPEGGFTNEEVSLAVQHGFTTVTLGKQILRTETAPLMILAALNYERMA